jgi:hypothetical protein
MRIAGKFALSLSVALALCATPGLWSEDIGVSGRVVAEGGGNLSPASSTVVGLAPQ